MPAFDIVNPGTGEVVGCADVASSGLVTAVFNEKVEGEKGFSGSLQFRARTTIRYEEGQTLYPVEFEFVGTVYIRMLPGLAPPPAELFRKDGWLTLPIDHQYFNPKRALSWRIITPKYGADLHNVVIADESEDEKWHFNCDHINANLLSERSTRISPEGSIDRSTITMTCETERLEIRIDTIPAGSTVTFDPIIGEIPNLVNGAYTNSAKLTADEIEEWTSNSKSVEIEGSGDGQGTQSPTPSPTETEVPSPSPSESESASESPSAAPMPTQTDDTDGPTQDPTESPAPDRDSDNPGRTPTSDCRAPVATRPRLPWEQAPSCCWQAERCSSPAGAGRPDAHRLGPGPLDG